MYFGVYFDLPAITVVVNKAQRILKFKPVEFNAGLKESYRWYVRHKFPKPDYTFEDALIAALKVKMERPEAHITYVRHPNKRGDTRHPVHGLAGESH